MLTEMSEWPSRERFLTEFWQKKPLLIRNAMPQAEHLLTPDELAGLSCLEGVEARLIQAPEIASRWTLTHGPFTAEQFAALPGQGWTLLVQRVDRLLAHVAELRQEFAFIANWRMDDIMVSYASDEGSVGPHVDLYDVFLIQGSGERDWQLGLSPVVDPALEPEVEVKILADFAPDCAVQVKSGDVLYLPPGLPHWGRARGEAMTYSVGFRAPAYRQLLTDYAAAVADTLPADWLYQDPDGPWPDDPGYLDQTVIKHFQETLARSLFGDPAQFAQWLGRWLTEPVDPEESPPLETETPRAEFYRQEGGRLVYWQDPAADQVHLFVEGKHWQLAAEQREFVAFLCRQTQFSRQELVSHLTLAANRELWDDLLSDGAFYTPVGRGSTE
jgi:50S ribosomal protein L16 3-hydroxylase